MKKYSNILFSSSSLAILDQAIFSGSNFLITLYLAQQLNPTSFGYFSSVTIITFLLLSISNALVIQPFQVTFSKIENKKQYVTFLHYFQFILLVICFFVIYGASKFMGNSNPSDLSISSLILFTIGYLVQDFYRKLFLGIGELVELVAIDSLFVLLVVVGFGVYHHSINLNYSLAIIGIANIISVCIGVYFIIRNYEFPILYINWLKLHSNQGKWLVSVSCLQWGSSNLFVLLSGAYLGVEALGALRLVQSIYGVINIVLQTVENYFIPKVAHLYNHSITEAKKYLFHLTAIGFSVFGALLSLLFMYSKNIMLFIGGVNYINYHFVIKMMALLYVFIFLSYPLRIVVRVLILNKIFFSGYVISFISSLITFHFLLQNYGLYGAIIGLIINQIVMMGYWYFELQKKYSVLWK